MSVKHQADAKTLGKRYVELVRDRNLPVQEVWIRDVSGVPELWIVIDRMNLQSERPIHQAIVDLHRLFPDSLFDDRVINLAWMSDIPLANVVPQDATKIKLRR